jgi:hypothetical protein
VTPGQLLLLGRKMMSKGVAQQEKAARKVHGRQFVCPVCRKLVRHDNGERVRPRGMTSDVRVCLACAERVKIAKEVSRKGGLRRRWS